MPGMNSGLNIGNPILVAAFRAALLHQGLIILVVLIALAVAWASVREWIPAVKSAAAARGAAKLPEPLGRRVLRIGFGVLWLLDGFLQAQPKMAAGLPSQTIEPIAATSPHWVRQLVNWAGTGWSYHPIQAGAAAVWIQVGIGAWLILAARGWPSRLAGLVSIGWGIVVWVFGEAFGGIFAPGLTFLFGAPGAVLFYCAAGALIALPDRYWHTAQLGRRILGCMGLFFVGMAVLQAWPGRDFWHSAGHGQSTALASMVHAMSTTSQPRFLSAWLSGFGSFAAAHSFVVNLVVVIALALIGAGLLSGQPRLLRPTLVLLVAVCLADWVLVQDLGFLGGLGTDPNSMIPIILVVIGGYLALVQVPPTEPAPVPEAGPAAAGATAEAVPEPAGDRPADGLSWRDRARPATLAQAFGATSLRAVFAAWAVAIIAIGAAPMALAQANPNADPIIAQAIDGDSTPLNFAAPAFALTNQNGKPVTLASLHGKVVLLTFLDPVCTTDCPVEAQEFRAAAHLLGSRARDVELVAIALNPVYYQVGYTRAFDRQEGLGNLANWQFLTGSLTQLRQIWRKYGVAAQITQAGGMVAHSEVAYVIDASGRTRRVLNFDPGPSTATTISSFAVELSNAAQQVMGSS